MTDLPGFYVPAAVVFHATRSLGDVDGDDDLDSEPARGWITFTPVESLYKSETPRATIVGNEVITAEVVDGYLCDLSGDRHLKMPIGHWRASFDLYRMKVPSTSFHLLELHDEENPFDLAAEVELNTSKLIPNAAPHGPLVHDTGDGGWEIEPQVFTTESGRMAYLGMVDNGDGGVTMTIEET